MSRISTPKTKKQERQAGVWELANQARYGRLSDYDWTKDNHHFTAYYLKPRLALVVEFDDKDKLMEVSLKTCRKGGKGSLRELFTELGSMFLPVSWVHSSSSLSGLRFDPAATLRSANTLRSLGQRTTLKAMKAYLSTLHKYRLCRHRYGFDEQKVIPLLKLLFARKKGAAKAPALELGIPDVLPKGNAFPLFPLAMQGNVPFLLINGYTRVGKRPTSVASLILDAEKNGVFQKIAAQPTALPYDAADAIIKSSGWQQLLSAKTQNRSTKLKKLRTIVEKRYRNYHASLLRRQAVSALRLMLSAKEQKANLSMGTIRKNWPSVSKSLKAKSPKWSIKTQSWKASK